MLTKGCDPELFLRDPKTGQMISSIGLIGGSKDFPQAIGEGCAVQEDNVAVEFNIPPSKSAEDFITSINFALNTIRQRAKELGLELCIEPSAVFDDVELMSPAAKEFGCEPDYNAWTGRENPRPKCDNKNLRSAGGHIHVSVPDGVDSCRVVQAMDLFVGCQMLKFDTDTQRRKLYGRAGACRFKTYGVEYRTASNAWIVSDERIRWVWEQTEKAVDWAETMPPFTPEQGQRIQDCINNSDLKLLEELNAEFGIN
ncbi:MAG: hypothetical protein KGI54_13565 [Pseudomonadota bacterium]|nr:hypothetical protein [Pseudomonadota bacterium]